MATRPDARRELRAELAWGAATLVLTCALAAIAMHLWNADMRVPFSYSGDANQNQMFIKGVLDHGWYQSNPSLGAPFGQKLYDFPVISGDNLQVSLMKAIGLFSSDSALVINLFYLLTFPLTAGIAFVCARILGVSRPAAAVISVLYALLPYHFIRGEQHLFIGAYYAVPLSVLFAVLAARGQSLGLRDPRRLALVVVACAVIGSAHVYYAAFGLILLAVAALVRIVAGSRRSASTAVVVAGLITVFVVANHLPNIAYRSEHGVNSALERTPAESESFGLKLASMVLPVEHHRVAALADVRQDYTDTTGQQLQEGQPQALGIVAAAGALGLVILAIACLAGGATERGPRAGPLPLVLGALVIAVILVGTVGGVSSIIAQLVTPQLRAWGRMSVFVAFFGLLAVALVADGVLRRRGRAAGTAVLGVILLIGFLDQTNAGSVPAYASIKASYQSDAALVRHIERTLGAGASVFQLPYQPFPEPQPDWVPALGPYDMARGYIHSHNLRWSYGLMKGRAGDWQNALVQLPPALLARAIASAGFTGLYVNRTGYADGGPYVLRELARETGAAPVVSPDRVLLFLDLRRYAARLRANAGPAALARLRHAVLIPVTVTPSNGFSGLHQDPTSRFRLMRAEGEILLDNPDRSDRRMRLVATLVPASPAPADVLITLPGGAVQRVHVPPRGALLDTTLTAPPGRSAIVLRVHGQAQTDFPGVQRAYYLRVVDPVVVDGAFNLFGPLPKDRRAAAYMSPFGAI